MTLHIYDCAYNNAYDRGDILSTEMIMKDWGPPRILVPMRHHDEVRGLALMLDLKANFHYVNWQYGVICLEGWWVVIDPEIEHFVIDPMYRGQPRLEPRRI